MTGTVQTFSLLCCFALFFLLPDHLTADSSAPFRAPEPGAAPLEQPSAGPGLHTQKPGERSEIHDIYGPIPLPEPPPYLLYGLGALLIAGAGGLLLVVQRFRKNHAKRVRIDPAAQALADLRKAEEIYGESGDPLRYCDDVAALLRTYVEQVTGYRLSCRTTLESLRELEESASAAPVAASDRLDLLRRCFTRCDLVKFARCTPDRDELGSIGELAASIVAPAGTVEEH